MYNNISYYTVTAGYNHSGKAEKVNSYGGTTEKLEKNFKIN